MPNSFSAWELIVALLAAVIGFFVSFAPHAPRSRAARAVILVTPFVLLVISQYLWATTGRGLIERITCVFVPSGASCLPPPAGPPGRAQTVVQQAPKPAPVKRDAPPSSEPPASPAPTRRERHPPAQAVAEPAIPKTRYVTLTESNAKDIWSTSVYSYAPGGGGPGGGLENDKLRVGGWGDEYVALIQFDLPDIPCTSKVALQLYNNADSDAPTPMYLRAITDPWDWRRGDRLWWRNLPQTASPEGGIVPAPRLNAWTSIDITGLFGKWCTKVLPNYGLMLRPLQNGNNYDTFYSTRFAGDEDLRPRLLISR
jgi:hypothetical protein